MANSGDGPSDHDDDQLVTVEHSPSRAELREDSFVLTAVGIPSQIESTPDGEAELRVLPADGARAKTELRHYRHENLDWPPPKPERTRFRISSDALLTIGALLVGFFAFQHFALPPGVFERAVSSKRAFTEGEWWRPLTALFLHADVGHFASNFVMSLLLAGALTALVGSGLSLAGFVFAGTLGNLLNAYFYRGLTHHDSIGFSTAAFGAVGVWAGAVLVTESLPTRGLELWKRLIVPIGVALAILGGWGSSLETDYMAHFWGLLAGGLYGLLIGKFAVRAKHSATLQYLVTLGVFAAVGAAWVGAFRAG